MSAATTTSDRLRRLAHGIEAERISLDALIDRVGASATGLCLLLFGLVSLIPGIAPVLGVGLCLFALGMMLGRETPPLPGWLRRVQIDRQRLHQGLQRLCPLVAWFEKWLQPRRAAGLLRGPASRLVGVAALVNGILIVLPIPFGNTAPAVATILLALGLVVGDGLAVGAGLLASVAALAIDVALVVLGFAAVAAAFSAIF